MDCGAFGNIRRNIDVANRGSEVGDCDLNRVGGAGSVVVGDSDGDVVIASFGEGVGLEVGLRIRT